MLQPAEPINSTPNLQPENMVQPAKDSGSDSESEVWSFNSTIYEDFRLLPQELYPKTRQEQTPVKPLSGMQLHY